MSKITAPDTITVDGIVYVRSDLTAAPKECLEKKCDYYWHYLPSYNPEQNGERLEHEAYHHASEKCRQAQERVIKWLDEFGETGRQVPETLERQADYWERRVAA